MWLARGDFAQIEARMLPWLAGQESELEAFRAYDAGTGPDTYIIAASGIYRCRPEEVTKPRRQVGKVAKLALGYQGGAHALQNMARAYGVKIPHAERPKDARGWQPPLDTDEWIKTMWRAANPRIASMDPNDPGLWLKLERTAMECVAAAPGKLFVVRDDPPVLFVRNKVALSLRLPSGRPLIYWNPRLASVTTSWGQQKWAVKYRAEDAVTKRWTEFVAYGGLYAENLTQASARDVMAEALIRIDDAIDQYYRDVPDDPEPGGGIVLTVHDEGVAAIPRGLAATAEQAAEFMRKHMLIKSAWLGNCPINADASAHFRYVKGD